MQAIDKKQQSSIILIGAVVTTITAIIGIMAYMDNRKHQKLQEDMFSIDRQLKLLRLAEEKNKIDGILTEKAKEEAKKVVETVTK
jgi:Tfp pilus assembly protein PilN